MFPWRLVVSFTDAVSFVPRNRTRSTLLDIAGLHTLAVRSSTGAFRKVALSRFFEQNGGGVDEEGFRFLWTCIGVVVDILVLFLGRGSLREQQCPSHLECH